MPADTTTKVTVGPLPWRADQASYWWPNVPYRAGYRAQLHELDIRLRPAHAGHADLHRGRAVRVP